MGKLDKYKHFDGIPLEREHDPEVKRLLSLFKPLADKYGNEAVLNYIESETDIVSAVTSGWLEGTSFPSSGIRKKILSYLEHLKNVGLAQPEQLPLAQTLAPAKAETDLPLPQNQPVAKRLTKKEKLDLAHKKAVKEEENVRALMESLRKKGIVK